MTKAEAVDFRVKNEPWLRYKLQDGTLLLARLVVLKVFRTDQYDPAGQPVYAWTASSLFTTIVKKEQKGTPSPTPLASMDPRDYNTSPVDFEKTGTDEWNVYETVDGSVISLKMEITQIMKTDKYGPDGDPFYMISAQTVPRVRVNPNLIKKQAPLPKAPSEKRQVYG